MAECGKSAALYNRVNYIYRQAYTGKHENIPDYADLVRKGRFVYAFDIISRMRKLKEAHFYAMTKLASAGQTVMQVDYAWKAWLRSLAGYAKYPAHFRGQPRMPGYKQGSSRSGGHVVVYTANDARLHDDGRILISRGLWLPIRTKVQKLRQVRIVPCRGEVRVDVVYEKPLPPVAEQSAGGVAGVDMGLNNLMAITSSEGQISCLVNGRPLKAMSHYYTCKLSAIRAKLAEQGLTESKRMNRLHAGFRHRVKDYMHKASRRAAELMAQCGISSCYIGYEPEWQTERRASQGRRVGGIPLGMLANMLKYKAEELGVRVSFTRESRTSRCSYLDGESPADTVQSRGRRVYRGLYVSGDGVAINADINAALNIMSRCAGLRAPVYAAFFSPTKLDIGIKHPNQPPAADRVDRGRACPGIPTGV